jgi:serine/threonine protein kinase
VRCQARNRSSPAIGIADQIDESVAFNRSLKHVPEFADNEVLQGRYRIVRQLGAGGMGAVYEALDERLQVTVAIKETFAVDGRLRRQFEREARLLAGLSHPALPRVSDYFTENGRAFLVMQFIGGDDLAQIISARPGPLPRAQVIAWADQLLDALVYLHTRERQIIHRDIKPHNLKRTSSGQIVLLDFGLAKTHAGSDQSTTQSYVSVFGFTRRYSPLEQIQDLGTSPQSDIYALGATLYHLLTGIKPPDALARASAVANSQPDPLRPADEIQSIVGAELAATLHKAMALNASDRFENAIQFREALRGIGRNEGVLRQAQPVGAGAMADHRTASASLTTDPFDSYSILRPEDEPFRLSRRKHVPAFFAAGLATLLIAITIAYPGQAINSAAGMMDSASRASDAAALPAAKSDPRLMTKSMVIKNALSSSSGAIKRTNESQKRAAQTPRGAKPLGVKPPPFSIAP